MKNLLKLGKALSKAEQKTINGGGSRVICQVMCPSYCHCAGSLHDECARNDDNSYCAAL